MATSSDPSSGTFTRRRMLGWSGASAISGMTAYFGWTPSTQAAVTVRATHRDDFLPHLNTTFRLKGTGTNCTLYKISRAAKLTAPAAVYTSFSLLFAAPAGFEAESKVYTLTHPKLGTIELFLSPVGKSKKRVVLEAICSRRV